MCIQGWLNERGLTKQQLHEIFTELDSSGDGQLDWGEFKRAMKMLGLKVPVAKLRQLFAQFDEDEGGEIDYYEFCRLLFPNMDEGGELPQASDEAAAANGSTPASVQSCAHAASKSWPHAISASAA